MTDASVPYTGLLMAPDVACAGWRGLEPQERWKWFQHLYHQVTHLDRRYRLGLRTGWWEDDVQLELLAALGAWVGMYDHAHWTDPEAKTRLLFGLQEVRQLVRGGSQQFHATRDREAFEQHLRHQRGCQEPSDVA